VICKLFDQVNFALLDWRIVYLEDDLVLDDDDAKMMMMI